MCVEYKESNDDEIISSAEKVVRPLRPCWSVALWWVDGEAGGRTDGVHFIWPVKRRLPVKLIDRWVAETGRSEWRR